MNCPECGNNKWLTTETRKKEKKVARIKKCKHCSSRFTSTETLDLGRFDVQNTELSLLRTDIESIHNIITASMMRYLKGEVQ